MTLFDQENATTDFDADDKVRLFETQQRSQRSVKDYAKVFLPVALFSVVLVAGVLYLIQPGIGDVVKAPKYTEDAVYNYMLTKEKRTASEMTFYKCDGYYWVKVVAEPRSYPPSNLLDDVNQYRLIARESTDGAGQIMTLPLPSKENDVACKQ